jgi:hypothetical protein
MSKVTLHIVSDVQKSWLGFETLRCILEGRAVSRNTVLKCGHVLIICDAGKRKGFTMRPTKMLQPMLTRDII